MHPNPVYHTGDDIRNLAYARDRGFGVLAVSVDGAPLLSHVPFIVSEDGKTLDLHLVRSNPIARALKTPLQARIAVSGPDSYISPDWYEMPDQVPTWNYVAVHLTGTLELRSQEKMLELLDRQSAVFEARLDPKPRWTTGKMDVDALAKMIRMIVPCRMQITSVDGTWKLSQNKPEDVRQRTADQVESYGQGAELRLLAALMRGA
ncbi:MAG: FMN-binding negative transcriptional regulator [Rhodobacteraceae bacterium]|nr:FMN-binding negative transcriptional regulator [Paracoccaceae bacterium]